MSSPLFTPAKPRPGQSEIPMGTHHVCRQCGNSYICDQPNCSLEFGQECGGPNSLPHSQQLANIEATQKQLAIAAAKAQGPSEYQRDLFQQEIF